MTTKIDETITILEKFLIDGKNISLDYMLAVMHVAKNNGRICPKDIADAMGKTGNELISMYQIIRRLDVEYGLIEKFSSKEDRRMVYLRLTPKGKNLITRLKRIRGKDVDLAA